MIHARNDYQRIQDPNHQIPQDEPVFLLRAQDIVSAETVRFWAAENIKRGGSVELSKSAIAHADRMDRWHTKKPADAPEGVT